MWLCPQCGNGWIFGEYPNAEHVFLRTNKILRNKINRQHHCTSTKRFSCGIFTMNPAAQSNCCSAT
jgi:hypothetical protein